MADWEQANFKPDLTDRTLPSTQVRTVRLAVADPTVSAPLSSIPVFARTLRIRAEHGNKGTIFVGSQASLDLTVNGYPLTAGEQMELTVNDLSVVYFQGDTLDDAVRIMYSY